MWEEEPTDIFSNDLMRVTHPSHIIPLASSFISIQATSPVFRCTDLAIHHKTISEAPWTENTMLFDVGASSPEVEEIRILSYLHLSDTSLFWKSKASDSLDIFCQVRKFIGY